MGNELLLDGINYISSKRLSEITGYTHDYLGRLCREKKVNGKLIGRNWFIDPESLNSYRETLQFFSPVDAAILTSVKKTVDLEAEKRDTPSTIDTVEPFVTTSAEPPATTNVKSMLSAHEGTDSDVGEMFLKDASESDSWEATLFEDSHANSLHSTHHNEITTSVHAQNSVPISRVEVSSSRRNHAFLNNYMGNFAKEKVPPNNSEKTEYEFSEDTDEPTFLKSVLQNGLFATAIILLTLFVGILGLFYTNSDLPKFLSENEVIREVTSALGSLFEERIIIEN